MCPSVCLSVTNFDPHYLETGKKEWAEIFLGHLWEMNVVKKIYLTEKWQVGLDPRARTATLLTQNLSSLTWDQAEIFKDFLAGNNYPYHSQGCVKFATQISPLLSSQLFDEIG